MQAVAMTVLDEPVYYITFNNDNNKPFEHRYTTMLVLANSGFILPVQPNGRHDSEFHHFLPSRPHCLEVGLCPGHANAANGGDR
jgi:hypothetical protein